MARDAEIDAGYKVVPSPQWGVVWRVLSGFSSSVDKWDIGGKRDVSGGVKLLVNMKKAGNRSL